MDRAEEPNGKNSTTLFPQGISINVIDRQAGSHPAFQLIDSPTAPHWGPDSSGCLQLWLVVT